MLVFLQGIARPHAKCRHALYRCECGSEFIAKLRDVETDKLTACKRCATRHVAAENTTHGQTASKEYRAWRALRSRCSNPNDTAYADYGARGIRVCHAWGTFEQFLADMGPAPTKQHSIDRIDNDGDYAPGNCRWATRHEQANNRRSARLLTANGTTKSLAAWATETGIPRTSIATRIDRFGWTPERAIATPVRRSSQCKA